MKNTEQWKNGQEQGLGFTKKIQMANKRMKGAEPH